MNPGIQSSTIYNIQDMETTQVNQQMIDLRRCGVYMYMSPMEYYSVIKRMKYCHFQQCRWTWRNYNSEISQTKTNTILYYLYVESEK